MTLPLPALDCFHLYEDADFYDVEFGSRDFEIPFFLAQSLKAGGPVLEVACGTGRITLPIARAGVDITGLDVSRPMIEQARNKSHAEGLLIDWLEQDCREMRLPREYALIFSATNAMQHLHDLNSVCAFLRSARNALRPEGCLILDVFNPDPAKLARSEAERYLHKTFQTSDGTEVRVQVASRYHSHTQILHFNLSYSTGNRLLRTKSVNMRCFYPEELLALCRWNGLDVVNRIGNYDGSSFGEGAPKQILFCKRDAV